MHLTIPQIVLMAGVLCLASTVQSAIGFAYALVATPLLIWADIPLPHVVTMVAACSFLQAVIGARHLRASIPWRVTLLAMAVRVSMLMVGLLILRRISAWDTGRIKFAVGMVLCLLVITQLFGRDRPAREIHWAWGPLAFGASGLLAGACGMGGPPLVLWALAHPWPVEKTRGFLFAVFAASIPIQLVLLYLTFGTDILRILIITLLLSPAVFAGAAIGLPLGNRLSRPVLCGIVYAVLLVIGLSSIVPYLLHTLR